MDAVYEDPMIERLVVDLDCAGVVIWRPRGLCVVRELFFNPGSCGSVRLSWIPDFGRQQLLAKGHRAACAIYFGEHCGLLFENLAEKNDFFEELVAHERDYHPPAELVGGMQLQLVEARKVSELPRHFLTTNKVHFSGGAVRYFAETLESIADICE